MLRRLLTVGLIAGLAACGDSTGPEDFDAQSTQLKAQAVLGAFDQNLALQSLSVLGSTISFGAAQAALAAGPFDPTATPATTAERLRALRNLSPSFGGTGALALFPTDLLGKTFVWDVQLGHYVLDANATGAPADGIRFILYAVDPVLGRVLTPLNDIGYFDLIDVSTASADAVQLVAVVNDVTYLDYTASASKSTTSATVGAVGFLSNGTDQVDFDLSATLSGAGFSVDYLIEADQGSVRLVASLTEAGLSATLTLEGDGDTVEMELAIGTSTIEGGITYNGDLAVEIGGTPEQPTFTRPDGTPLTENEINALMALGAIIDQLFEAFDNLLAPALIVFAIG
jgi:hypothetical protein